ncbi:MULTISPECIES: hypothetical protein [unclassified Bradyrhizobium]|uniref:hypothetical protein n=1 Tax=unclassified Bradyrhizobium TaxID=2631580 RepID=UPI0024E0A6D1|nr:MULTISPECIES: hypothetical protein [unclassified Bradyrhizobium]
MLMRLRIASVMGANKPVPREIAKQPLKPPRGEGRVVRLNRGTCRLHFFPQAGHGPQSRSGLPRALSFVEGDAGSMTWMRMRCGAAVGCLQNRAVDAVAVGVDASRAAVLITPMRWNGRTTISVSSRP